MSVNYNAIDFFLIYGKFATMRKPDSGRIFINNNLLSYETWKQN